MQKHSTVHSRTCCKKQSESSQAPYLFLRQEEYAGTEYSSHSAKAWADLLGFAVPFYLVQLLCALLICEAFSDVPQVNRVPMRLTHKLKNSISLKQLNKPCIVTKSTTLTWKETKNAFFPLVHSRSR